MMGLHARQHEDRALTPVVGILLLLAITVLLGATTASFMIGLGADRVENGAPTAKFSVEYHGGSGNDSVTLKHESGQNVVTEHAYLDVTNAKCRAGGTTYTQTERLNLGADFDLPTSEMKAGMTVQIRPDTDFDGTAELCASGGTLDLSDSSVDIVWDAGSGSRFLYRWGGP